MELGQLLTALNMNRKEFAQFVGIPLSRVQPPGVPLTKYSVDDILKIQKATQLSLDDLLLDDTIWSLKTLSEIISDDAKRQASLDLMKQHDHYVMIKEFMQSVESLLDGVIIPMSYLYQAYVERFRSRSSEPSIKSTTFSKLVMSYLDESDVFKMSKDRMRFSSTSRNKALTFAETARRMLNIDESSKKVYYLVPKNPITTADIKRFKKRFRTTMDFTQRDRLISDHLVNTLGETQFKIED